MIGRASARPKKASSRRRAGMYQANASPPASSTDAMLPATPIPKSTHTMEGRLRVRTIGTTIHADFRTRRVDSDQAAPERPHCPDTGSARSDHASRCTGLGAGGRGGAEPALRHGKHRSHVATDDSRRQEKRVAVCGASAGAAVPPRQTWTKSTSGCRCCSATASRPSNPAYRWSNPNSSGRRGTGYSPPDLLRRVA